MDNKQLQKMLDDSVKAKRSDDMKTSKQLILCELISKLENVKNKELPIIFDDSDHIPTAIGSWRGAYSELAICYEGGDTFNTNLMLFILGSGKNCDGYHRCFVNH